jgi:hydroxypyruvate isomerase
MPKFAADLTKRFTEQPLLDRFGARNAAGFQGGDYLFRHDVDKRQLARPTKATWADTSLASPSQ